ncbi:2-succinyl-5-enolpyruvyl-6-hydroxy-3-cyclohexene-1-carboxylic-acid synthase [uncultured Mobiluncus sp.]|uniref:2-succinyl-5-enolpyruvyl-6-hydroxy-3- cyclohexene-1-carboxylic-acid synthase n=1 Tax=uncultured Mobiluncus sp. TaxID=293425 RepID=UPI0025E56C74|nr:2-succinyl-5-enolpyruvyl-6-hydroxy-3-cyclohexene-1-carboxylic-acid synthase [uncultured Mobiluncus sp.]
MDNTGQRDNQDASNQQYAGDLVHLLAAQGFTEWFYCPGSRDAPLGYALNQLAASHRLNLHVRIDERDASFMALGATRAGHPAVLVMTSGTAVGNALPAVMEAAHAGLPLLVLSADRPAALRGTGANQTTWQPGIFGDFVRFATDIQPGVTAAELQQAVSAAVASCRGVSPSPHRATDEKHFPLPGPVHINASFIEPLAPPETIEAFAARASASAIASEYPLDPHQAPRGTLLIAGDLSDATYADLCEAVKNAGIPVLAEPQTAWRRHPNAVRGYAKAAGTTLSAVVEHNLERVIVSGRPTLTRPITRLVTRRDIPVETVGAPGTTVNLADNIARQWTDAPTLACELAKVAKPSPPAAPHQSAEAPQNWLEMWRTAGENAIAALSGDWGLHSAAQVIWDSTMTAPEPVDLYLGASLTIRVFDAVARNSAPRRVFTNRGLAGIDGTIASAWGAALARRQPMRLVLGDVSFFHDLGALCHGRTEEVPNLQVIVINNGGGRIFGGLEHGVAPADTFTRMFLTAQVGDVCGLARAAGWQAERVDSLAELASALTQPVKGLSLLEVVL